MLRMRIAVGRFFPVDIYARIWPKATNYQDQEITDGQLSGEQLSYLWPQSSGKNIVIQFYDDDMHSTSGGLWICTS